MESKPFYMSVTFWGLLLATVAPLAKSFGFELTDTEGLAESLSTLVGVLVALYGRAKATQPLHITEDK